MQLLLLFVLFINSSAYSQIRWDGEAGDGQWMTAQNWTGDVVPAVTDDVVLDNTFINASYTVTLPSGNVGVQIKAINISALTGNIIQLILPVSNTAIPAFTVTGTVYGMVIGNGGIFKNSSGAAGGETVVISDSLKINNGGRFVQNSQRSHAAIVAVLSKSPGTEEGIFEFDIPAASNTISLSGRTYGKLVLSSNAMNGVVTYTASGTNTVTARTDLETGAGVTLSLNFSDTLFIGRDLIQQGGTINLANSTRSLVTAVNRHMLQSAAGVIGETGSASPEMIFNGNINQQIDCKGIIKDNVTITMNNAAGATLLSPLSLPYSLNLVRGAITTTSANMLTLLSGCSITADSLLNNSFVNGPLRKENISGAAHFLFPVGKENTMGWLALKNATGHFTVEFFKSNPQQISTVYGPGIHHISSIEYWTVQADVSPLPSAAIELSFTDPNGGVGPDLSTYRVTRLTNNTWVNAGNTAVTGTAGNRGSVVSNNITDLIAAPEFFTLGSSVAANSPLALVNDTAPVNRNISGNRRLPYLQLLYITASPLPMLACRANEKTRVTFYFTSITGQVIKTITATIERGINNLPVPLLSLPAGVYCLRAFTNKGQPSNMLRFVKGIN